MPPQKSVVLIYPKLEKYNPHRIHYFPLPILSIAGPLSDAGYKVIIFDSRIESNFVQFLDSLPEEPLFFGMSVMVGYQIVDGVTLSRDIKKKFPDVPVVWGGWFPSLEPDVIMNESSVDVGVRGPGERTVIKLARCIEEKGDLATVGSLIYRKNGEIVVDDPAMPEDINDFKPYPYHLIDHTKYNCVDQHEVNYITSSGCPYDCRFCCVTYIYHRRWFGLNAERVIEDISELVKHYGIKHFEFQDDNFFASKKRAKTILKGIIDRKFGITWTGQARFDSLVRFDDELFDLIKKSGCKCLYASGESGSERILEVIRKRIAVDQIVNGVKLLEEHGIPLRTTFMVGLPKETPDDLRMTLDLSRRLLELKKEIYIYYSFYRPVPSTDLFNQAVDEHIIERPRTLEEWAQYAPLDQKQFRLFLREKTTKSRNEAKKLAFYFWFANYRPFIEMINGTGLGLLFKIVKPIFQVRYRYNLLQFPVEWHFFNLIYKIRPGLFYRDKQAD